MLVSGIATALASQQIWSQKSAEISHPPAGGHKALLHLQHEIEKIYSDPRFFWKMHSAGQITILALPIKHLSEFLQQVSDMKRLEQNIGTAKMAMVGMIDSEKNNRRHRRWTGPARTQTGQECRTIHHIRWCNHTLPN